MVFCPPFIPNMLRNGTCFAKKANWRNAPVCQYQIKTVGKKGGMQNAFLGSSESIVLADLNNIWVVFWDGERDTGLSIRLQQYVCFRWPLIIVIIVGQTGRQAVILSYSLSRLALHCADASGFSIHCVASAQLCVLALWHGHAQLCGWPTEGAVVLFKSRAVDICL